MVVSTERQPNWLKGNLVREVSATFSDIPRNNICSENMFFKSFCKSKMCEQKLLPKPIRLFLSFFSCSIWIKELQKWETWKTCCKPNPFLFHTSQVAICSENRFYKSFCKSEMCECVVGAPRYKTLQKPQSLNKFEKCWRYFPSFSSSAVLWLFRQVKCVKGLIWQLILG